MRELLNLPGPWFIAAYLALGVAALMLRPLFRRMCPAASVPTATGAGELSAHQMAYLAGGARRACETALVSLAQNQSVKPRDGGSGFATEGPRPAAAGELDKAVFDSLKAQGGLVPSGSAGQAALQRLADTLGARGLLHAPGSAHLRCARWAANIPLLALATVGASKIVIGVQRDRPVAILVLLVLATIAFMWFARGPAAVRTRLGNKTLEVLNKRNAALRTTLMRRPADLTGADLSVAVALFGVSVLAGGPYDWVAQTLVPPSSDSGSTSSGDSSSSSSSSSCSSGSSCGGGSGCGGCGS